MRDANTFGGHGARNVGSVIAWIIVEKWKN